MAALLPFPLAVLVDIVLTDPVPLEYGKDMGKMKLMDKFGQNWSPRKEAFDDINCMLNYYNAHEEEHGSYAHKLVIDFTRPGTFIEAGQLPITSSRLMKSKPHGKPGGGLLKTITLKEKQRKVERDFTLLGVRW